MKYSSEQVKGAVSHWVTACGAARTADQRTMCMTVAGSLEPKPIDGTPTVLSDIAVGAKASPDLVKCAWFAARASEQADRRDEWDSKTRRCIAATPVLLDSLRTPDGAKVPRAENQDCGLDQVCRVEKAVQDAIAAGIRNGILGLVDLFVQGVAVLWSELAKLVLTSTSIGAPDEAFHFAYNSAAGILILLVFLFFVISTAISAVRTRGPGPVATLGGLVRAVLGMTLAGGIAWLVVTAWDEATNALIEHNSTTPWDASAWITSLKVLASPGGTGAIVLIVALFSLIGLALLFIMLLFRGLLTTGAALIGAMAMAGQASPQTQHWGRKWFWSVNALAASKFWIVLFWIYGTRATYSSNDLTTVLQGLLLIWLMVLTPGIMLRLTSVVDGYLADVDSRGMLSAAAAGAGDVLGGRIDKALSPSSTDGDANGLMNANLGSMPSSPADGLKGAVGLDDGPMSDALDAADTSRDGGKVSDVSTAGAPGDGGDGGGDAGEPNAAEADGVAEGTASARHDLATGTLSAPGESSGDGSGAVPVSPTAIHGTASGNGADPTGVGLTHHDGPSGDQGGQHPSGADGPGPSGGPPGGGDDSSGDGAQSGSGPKGPTSGGSSGAAGGGSAEEVALLAL